MPAAVQKLVGCAAAALFVCGCGQQPQTANNQAAANAAQDTAPVLPTLPLPQPPLNREQLLVAVHHAASDFAAGINDGKRQQELSDKKFEFRIRFGCDGQIGEKSKQPRGYSFDKSTRALRVQATPTLSKDDAPVAAIADARYEAVEGFWIQKPWLLAAVCPKPVPQPAADTEKPQKTAPEKPVEAAAPSANAAQAAPPAQTVGVAEFFTATDPRTMRRSGRPYEATKKLEEGDVPTGGFDLVLSGRLSALPDGRVIACTATGEGQRPACVVSAVFGKVWIERADTHEQLAQWGPG